jgi:hypothetical protein
VRPKAEARTKAEEIRTRALRDAASRLAQMKAEMASTNLRASALLRAWICGFLLFVLTVLFIAFTLHFETAASDYLKLKSAASLFSVVLAA